tara:strand:+ start:391 stop:585 length:195 start_codon:yes stop_codon:yes gene_type:complete
MIIDGIFIVGAASAAKVVNGPAAIGAKAPPTNICEPEYGSTCGAASAANPDSGGRSPPHENPVI